jgi:hypothetical protein
MSGTFKWLESFGKVVPMPDQKVIGAYESVKKVMITELQSIPNWVFCGEDFEFQR